MIEVKNLTKRYGNHTAVDNLNFVVEEGEIVGFLGPNGAGKSTTMNIITGYISATEGTVLVNGYDIFEEPTKAKKCIGYLPEIPPLYMDMKVREYLHFVADLKKIKKKEQKEAVQRPMELTMIMDMSERLIKNLSKGYKQRVGLAGALIGNPEVLILDEPTVGLDPAQIIEIRDLIKDLSKSHTVILSSHILSEVSAVCDKVMIINKGRLLVSDTPENLSKRMSSSDGIILSIKGEQQKVSSILHDIKGVSDITFEQTKEEGMIHCTVLGNNTSEVKEEIFYALADAKCPIYEMKNNTMSLEDVFLEVTKETDQIIKQNEKEKQHTHIEQSDEKIEEEEKEQ